MSDSSNLRVLFYYEDELRRSYVHRVGEQWNTRNEITWSGSDKKVLYSGQVTEKEDAVRKIGLITELWF